MGNHHSNESFNPFSLRDPRQLPFPIKDLIDLNCPTETHLPVSPIVNRFIRKTLPETKASRVIFQQFRAFNPTLYQHVVPYQILINRLHISGASSTLIVFAMLEQARHQNPITKRDKPFGTTYQITHHLKRLTLARFYPHKVRQLIQSSHTPNVTTGNIDHRYSNNRMILPVRLALTRA